MAQTPTRKMQTMAVVKADGYKYLIQLQDLFVSLDEKRKEEEKAGENDKTLCADRLEKMGLLYRTLVLACDGNTTEALMSDQFYMNFFGALEYLPEIKGKLLCREFFEKCKFKEVVPIENEQVLKKIHLCYRVNFIKETIFAKEDGQVSQSLACICLNLTIEILRNLLQDVDYLRKVVQETQL